MGKKLPMVEKPALPLFRRVKREYYEAVYMQLNAQRKMHPKYSDEQLLMYMLCEAEADVCFEHPDFSRRRK